MIRESLKGEAGKNSKHENCLSHETNCKQFHLSFEIGIFQPCYETGCRIRTKLNSSNKEPNPKSNRKFKIRTPNQTLFDLSSDSKRNASSSQLKHFLVGM